MHGRISAPVEAAAVYFLTMSICRSSKCWPDVLEHWTGIAAKDLRQAVTYLHELCFLQLPISDHE